MSPIAKISAPGAPARGRTKAWRSTTTDMDDFLPQPRHGRGANPTIACKRGHFQAGGTDLRGWNDRASLSLILRSGRRAASRRTGESLAALGPRCRLHKAGAARYHRVMFLSFFAALRQAHVPVTPR